MLPSRIHTAFCLSFCLFGIWINVCPQTTNFLKSGGNLLSYGLLTPSHQIWLKFTPNVVGGQDDHISLFPFETNLKMSSFTVHGMERTHSVFHLSLLTFLYVADHI